MAQINLSITHFRIGSILFRTAVLALLGLGGTAQAADHWLDSKSGCRVWSDKALNPGEVLRWDGPCEGETASGSGTLTVTDGAKQLLRFDGAMRGGKANGPGEMVLTTVEGDVRYDGGFKESLLDGYGVLELADGGRYEGGFENDAPHGYGLYRAADGSLYQGELKDGLPHGNGYDVFADGERYHGTFQDGKRHGEGVLLLSNGDVYEGGFLDGKANGKGSSRSSVRAS